MPDLSMFGSTVGTHKFPAGHRFFAQGDPGDVMYVVINGDVQVTVNEKIVETVRTGGIFGEMAIIDNRERSAAARAITPVEVAQINQQQFLYLIRTHPLFSIEVMNVMADRLRLLNQALL